MTVAPPAWRRWAPAVLWAALQLALTSIPNPGVPSELRHLDKVTHAALYAVLATLVVRALPPERRTPPTLALVLVGISAFGWADEWHQQFIPGRGREIADWLADSVGGALAILTTSALRRREQPT